MNAIDTRFLDSFLEYRGNESKTIITLEYFFEHAEFKDLFEFAVYCNDKDSNYMYDFLDSIWFLYSNYYDETLEKNIEILDYYEYLLDSFMKERNVILKKEERLYREYADIRLMDAVEYVFDLYNKDCKYKQFYLDFFSNENLWVENITELLREKINEVFIREWGKLKQRFAVFDDSAWKDKCMLLLGLGFLNDKSLYSNTCNYKSYNHSGLYVNEQFISDNNLVSADEMINWLEGIVHLTLKELGMKYENEKIQYVEQFINTEELETEIEIGR